MKKILRLITALGIVSLLISVSGCDMATEEELLAAAGKTINNNDSNNNVSPGNSSSSIWSMFDGADMQTWEGTVSLQETGEGLELTINNGVWWGMCFCNSAGAKPTDSDCVTFDMSKVKTITFEAKSSEKASMWICQSDSAAETIDKKKIDLSTDFGTKTYTLSNPGKKNYGVFDLGGSNDANGLFTTSKVDLVITIRNVKFLDANGKEIVPSRNK